MLELIATIASVGAGAIATYSWIEEHHGLSIAIYSLSLFLGLISIKSLCGG